MTIQGTATEPFGPAAAVEPARPLLASDRSFSLTLGMPHLGRNNLSESALYRDLGHARWEHLESLGGTPTAQIVDDQGARLYPTFFFIELDVPPERPLSAYGENARLEFIADLRHHGRTHLDGSFRMISGHGTIRLGNVFVHQRHGPAQLAVAFPANVDFTSIPPLAEGLDSLTSCKQARLAGRFDGSRRGDIPLFEGERRFDYCIDPDRDLNGAGLVYFIHYVTILDTAERRILSELECPVPSRLVDSRSTYHRRMAYFGNSADDDTLLIYTRARARRCPEAGKDCIDIGCEQRIVRRSDGRQIALSASRKIAVVDDAASRDWSRCLDA